ncbi:MAG: nucleoside recognition protein [Ignavibacteriae bacterium HGW-Ignavibacteriae-2]|nr:MAG: nucleoside recognition protein [Ignavibacteriae bacterium HGW-Ignavibacteriae-2]
MLNYVWLALLILGIGVALSTDIIDQSNNKYRNGEQLAVTYLFEEPYSPGQSKSYNVKIVTESDVFSKFYGLDQNKKVEHEAKLTVDSKKGTNVFFLTTNSSTPAIWQKIAKMGGKNDDLTGSAKLLSIKDSYTAEGTITLEEVSFATMRDVTNAALDYASTAVNIAIGLIGIMALWLGIMKVAEQAGLIKIIARSVRPITKFLFPDVPHDHPAMGSMIMNISANMLGLGNAATPFGLKAMEELNELNDKKDTATNAMCTFLAVNTAGLTLIPATAIAIRAAMGSSNPTIIIGTSIVGAACATTVGITSAKILEKFTDKSTTFTNWLQQSKKKFLVTLGLIAGIIILAITGLLSIFFSLFENINPDIFKNIITTVSTLAIPLIIFTFLLYGFVKKVKVYESFVEGAKEGFTIAVKIIPYLVGMLVAIGIFRAGGVMGLLEQILAYPASLIGMPVEAIPMALIRPLSGSGSTGVMTEIMAIHGPDSYIGILVSTFFGSTETTFYVLAVYFGAVNITKTRHALAAGLLADLAGILGAVFIVNLLFG